VLNFNTSAQFIYAGRGVVQVLFQMTTHSLQMFSLKNFGLNIQLIQIKLRYKLAIGIACDCTGRKRVFSCLATSITTPRNKLKIGVLYANKM
jgi:hypothetical protein